MEHLHLWKWSEAWSGDRVEPMEATGRSCEVGKDVERLSKAAQEHGVVRIVAAGTLYEEGVDCGTCPHPPAAVWPSQWPCVGP